MPKCTRQGCQREFDEERNEDGACMYHNGQPLFHEGLKSWSCCNDINRPVLDFESFMQIPGCTPGKHTAATNLPVPKPVQTSGGPGSNLSSTPVSARNTSQPAIEGKEVFSSSAAISTGNLSRAAPETVKPAPPPREDEDDPSIPVETGTKCLRNGCRHLFISQDTSRGTGEESQCVYHPMPPIFHEGSKGYLCCKRRVLEFDEFLKIQGCKTGKHLFVKKRNNESGDNQEELVQCRMDHYQTPTQVLASIYAKKVDASRSIIEFEDEKVHLDLFMPGSDTNSWKRFRKTVELWGPVKGSECKYSIKGTKVELTLVKRDSRSWTLLERTEANLGNISLTFGVGGRTGTIGSKELVLDEATKIRQ